MQILIAAYVACVCAGYFVEVSGRDMGEKRKSGNFEKSGSQARCDLSQSWLTVLVCGDFAIRPYFVGCSRVHFGGDLQFAHGHDFFYHCIEETWINVFFHG